MNKTIKRKLEIKGNGINIYMIVMITKEKDIEEYGNIECENFNFRLESIEKKKEDAIKEFVNAFKEYLFIALKENVLHKVLWEKYVVDPEIIKEQNKIFLEQKNIKKLLKDLSNT